MGQHDFHEHVRSDRGAGTPTSMADVAHDSGSFYSMENYHIGSVIALGMMASGSTATIALLEASDDAGTGVALVSGKTATLVGNDGSEVAVGTIDFMQEDFTTAAKYYVGSRITNDAQGDAIATVIVRMGARHKLDTPFK